jgi:hypothetical protein
LIYLNPVLLCDVAQDLEIDPTGVDIAPRVAVRDPVLHNFGHLLRAEAADPRLGSALMVESTVRALAVHLLRHHSNLAAINPPSRKTYLAPAQPGGRLHERQSQSAYFLIGACRRVRLEFNAFQPRVPRSHGKAAACLSHRPSLKEGCRLARTYTSLHHRDRLELRFRPAPIFCDGFPKQIRFHAEPLAYRARTLE